MRSVLAGLVALAAVACSSDVDPVSAPSASTVATPPATAPPPSPPTGSTVEPNESNVVPTADAPSEPSDTSLTTIDPDAVLPNGFRLVAARVTEPDGSVCEICLWLADDADRRSRGLMFVTDLGPADGMAFVYPEPHTTRFWMKNTVLPLSIAFFGSDGGFLSAFDMEPCTSDSCPRYRTPANILVAVETLQGGLPAIGAVPGSSLELLDRPC